MCMINETTPPSVIQEIIPEEIGCAGTLAALSVSKLGRRRPNREQTGVSTYSSAGNTLHTVAFFLAEQTRPTQLDR